MKKALMTASLVVASLVTSASASDLTDSLKEVASNSNTYFQTAGGSVRGTDSVIFTAGTVYKNFEANARIAKKNFDLNLNYVPISYKINDSITIFPIANLYYSKYKYDVTQTQTQTQTKKGGEPGETETTTSTKTNTETKNKSRFGFGLGGGLVLTKVNNLVLRANFNNNAELSFSATMPIPAFKHLSVTYSNSWLKKDDKKLNSHYIGINCSF